MWISFTRDQEFKLACLNEQQSLGSSITNRIRLSGRGLDPVHGLFYRDATTWHYRGLRTQSESELTQDVTFSLGDWKLEVVGEHLKEKTESLLLKLMHNLLSENIDQSMNMALKKLESAVFLNAEMPKEIESRLRLSFAERALKSPIESLLQKPYVSDILIDRFDSIWVSENGQLEKSPLKFVDETTYQIYIQNLLHQASKTLDETQAFADFNRENGTRFHLAGPSVSGGQIHVSIRKHRDIPWSLEKLFEQGMFPKEWCGGLKELIDQRDSILISGATSSGKTSLIKALLQEISLDQRLIVLEDSYELYLNRANSAFLQTRPDQAPKIDLRELVRQSLRMRPDRLIIGEVRGPESLDLLHAINTGHRGSMASIHANSARDAIARLQGLAMMASTRLSEDLALELVSRNIQVIIHCDREPSGARKIKEICRIQGRAENQILLERLYDI
ncbi:MAG: hypothetical protein COV44_01300 [Deltaproteobacteria bacterium CG11_big_fil_rev_8_21_14_0_20_45_16]|nr:MAG: hypothetical protein COV44_01300 [Deltaproteobacteria bacterium CG11_big_fil_rev_8_21_14_0_20_45_16]